ncbi:MAG: nickel pincer cofactor biosynthesis protein LarC [Phycisphaerae bacterium]
MKIAYFDCFSGAAGDMINAALLDAGCPRDAHTELLQGLNLPGVATRLEDAVVGGIASKRFHVDIAPQAGHKHRHLKHIVALIEDAKLPRVVVEQSIAIFRRLAEAEARVHATTIEKVHFHEVGADDAIIDIVGACSALHLLNVDEVHCSPVPTGSGTVRCEHGVMPVPAPATANLLEGVPLATCEEPCELTTPTGAAILTTLAVRFGTLPAASISVTGYGAGMREGKTRPNFLRVHLCETASVASEADVVAVLETQLDDATGEEIAHVTARLLREGALDAFVMPILMKKGRPGHLITVLTTPENAMKLQTLLLQESPTFGVRQYSTTRTILAREIIAVTTPFGDVRIKLGRRQGTLLHAAPEYDDCAAAAAQYGVPLRTVQQAALRAWEQGGHDAGSVRRG